MQTPRIQTIWQNSRIHHIDRGGVKNTSAESNFTFRACVRNENDNCLRILFRKMSGKALVARGFEPPWGKRKAPAFVSKAGTSYGIKRYRQVLCANSFTILAELSLHRAGKPALNYLVAEDRERVKGGEAACEALDVNSVFCYQPASSSCISMCFMLMYFFPPHWVPAT